MLYLDADGSAYSLGRAKQRAVVVLEQGTRHRDEIATRPDTTAALLRLGVTGRCRRDWEFWIGAFLAQAKPITPLV